MPPSSTPGWAQASSNQFKQPSLHKIQIDVTNPSMVDIKEARVSSFLSIGDNQPPMFAQGLTTCYPLPALLEQEITRVPSSNTVCFGPSACKQLGVFHGTQFTQAASCSLHQFLPPKGLATMSSSTNSNSGESAILCDSSNFLVRRKDGGIHYASVMFKLISRTEWQQSGSPTLSGHRFQSLPILISRAWAQLERQIVGFLTTGFPLALRAQSPPPH